MSTKRRLLSMALVALLALMPLAGLAEADVTQDLMDQCAAYLAVTERICAAELWALESMQAYCRSPSWDGLLRARAAAATVHRELTGIRVPTCTLTQAQFQALQDGGVDASFLPAEFSALQGDLDADIAKWGGALRDLDEDPFWTYGVERMGQWARIESEQIAINLAYTNATTNYLLLPLEAARADAFWQSMPQVYPALSQSRADWIADEGALLDWVDEVLNRLEALVNAQSGYAALLRDNLDILGRAQASGDWAELSARAVAIEGLPALMPNPIYFDASTRSEQYFWVGESAGDRRTVRPGDDLSPPPAQMIRYRPATKVPLGQYLVQLASLGIRPDATEGMDTGMLPWSLYYLTEGRSAMLSWEMDEAKLTVLDGSTCFAPTWYVKWAQGARKPPGHALRPAPQDGVVLQSGVPAVNEFSGEHDLPRGGDALGRG